ncbi:guanylate kinase [Helicobacter valdiviensis]|uniref:Guanylate kinase n=1 Tax=Helicobacter valdiviensis TaxID=1458358 RepID=A0A2W6NJ23_9HELI|nr:guanylate kinase [Helicobacter valdiviensis]PZT47356.1 guanylate kinase [Helicobacter valdiviensis]
MGDIKQKGAILILSGPSGAGKSSLYKALAKEFPNHYFSISSTTREKREGEINGVHYHFISQEEFKQGIEAGNFLEWAKVHGNYYGTSKKEVLEALSQDKLVVFDVDVQGQENIIKTFGKIATSVFVTTKDKKTLQDRLIARGSDTYEVIEKRLENAFFEMEKIQKFDYLIINEDLETATKELLSIVRVAFCKSGLYDLKNLLQKWNS